MKRKVLAMKSMKFVILAALGLCASGNSSYASVGYKTTTYTFEASPGQPAVFDGSTVTLGVPSAGHVDKVLFFDIKDPSAVGGQVMSGLEPTSVDITSILPSGWMGSFTIDYTKASGGVGTIDVSGNGSPGTITDNDPSANGVWTSSAVPDQASTGLLLGLAALALHGARSLRCSRRAP